jgi:hypothetical protein
LEEVILATLAAVGKDTETFAAACLMQVGMNIPDKPSCSQGLAAYSKSILLSAPMRSLLPERTRSPFHFPAF